MMMNNEINLMMIFSKSHNIEYNFRTLIEIRKIYEKSKLMMMMILMKMERCVGTS